MIKRYSLLLVCLVVVAFAVSGCGGSTKTQQEQQKLTNEYSQKLQASVPYPLAQMNFSQERFQLRERLLRFNKPDRVGYVYLVSYTGQYLGYYTILGKISATESQMTITQQIVKDCHSGCRYVVDSMGDDGSYGHNEGGPNGIFFFTTNGVLVETNSNFVYSDRPLPVNVRHLNPKQGRTFITK